MTRKYNGRIVHTAHDCSLIFDNESWVYIDLKTAFSDGAKVTVEIKSRRKPRSLAQNAYLHMVLQMIADETGNDLEDVKSTVKAMYAQKAFAGQGG